MSIGHILNNSDFFNILTNKIILSSNIASNSTLTTDPQTTINTSQILLNTSNITLNTENILLNTNKINLNTDSINTLSSLTSENNLKINNVSSLTSLNTSNISSINTSINALNFNQKYMGNCYILHSQYFNDGLLLKTNPILSFNFNNNIQTFIPTTKTNYSLKLNMMLNNTSGSINEFSNITVLLNGNVAKYLIGSIIPNNGNFYINDLINVGSMIQGTNTITFNFSTPTNNLNIYNYWVEVSTILTKNP